MLKNLTNLQSIINANQPFQLFFEGNFNSSWPRDFDLNNTQNY